jgi:DNA-directed RNA polymerase specialized sigma24 family protein
VSTHGHYRELGSPAAWVVTSRMLEQLTYAQIGDRLNISSEGARAIVKRNRLPRSHDKKEW